ncbi:fimbria/pilus outer membrane usher protein [Providencia sp.]|uniref:fimbria/pilus outer membrane usher protein n=1 Tax=Providencia sp. TaxID=589 RepID=UPI003F98ACA7
MDDKKKYSFIPVVIFCFFVTELVKADSNYIEFESRALELNDSTNINLNNFALSDYIPEGSYSLSLKVNGRVIDNNKFDVINVDGISQICFAPQTVEKFDLKASFLAQLNKRTVSGKSECILAVGYEGITGRIDRENSMLLVSIPQALLNYSDPDWTPPSQWDDGILGALFDYSLSGSLYNNRNSASTSNKTISSYGTLGVNYQAWRFRSNYQTSLYTDDSGENTRRFNASAAYVTRSLKNIGSHLTIGKDNLQSNVFESLDYLGISIASDNRMLPPAFRGYAPKLTGIAKTNAKIIVTRGDSIVYEAMVPPGPFVIEDLTDTTSGLLKMTVREEDGSEEISTIETSNVPFLTRSGHIRYKAMLGKMDQSNGPFKPTLATMEASLGIYSNISLFGGAIFTDKNYYAVNGGVGYDLGTLGALSIDVTHSDAVANQQNRKGESYRFNYSKVFDSIDSQITFAGYRFSDKDYLSLSNMVSLAELPDFAATSKESYNLVASKSFRDLGITLNTIYSRQTYWQDVSDSSSYGLSLSKSFDIDRFKNINVYISFNRTEYKAALLSQKQKNNNSVYVSLNIPLNSDSYLSTGMQLTESNFSPSMNYTNSSDPQNTWSIGAITNSSDTYKQSTFNGNIMQNRDAYAAAFNTSINKDSYYLGGNIKSGITATQYGVAVHRDGYAGNTRLVIDTGGIEGVYIGERGSNQSMASNAQGLTVINNLPDYYRTNYMIDANRLPDDVEITEPNIQMVLTEGAIGYRKLNLYRGIKVLIKLTDSQGNELPFGTLVDDKQQNRQVGVIGENGEVYLSGISATAPLVALDSEGKRCSFTLPNQDLSLSSIVPVTCHREPSSSGKTL